MSIGESSRIDVKFAKVHHCHGHIQPSVRHFIETDIRWNWKCCRPTLVRASQILLTML